MAGDPSRPALERLIAERLGELEVDAARAERLFDATPASLAEEARVEHVKGVIRMLEEAGAGWWVDGRT